MKITDVGAAYDPQFERVEMSNLDKVFERNRITKQGIDAMITNYLRLERELVAAQAEIVRLKGEAESWEKVFDRTCEHLADTKTKLAEATKSIVQECASIIKDAVDHREPASTYADKIKKHFGVEE
jgi:predicted  nucleic acid-binding Zn-ribbon protein